MKPEECGNVSQRERRQTRDRRKANLPVLREDDHVSVGRSRGKGVQLGNLREDNTAPEESAARDDGELRVWLGSGIAIPTYLVKSNTELGTCRRIKGTRLDKIGNMVPKMEVACHAEKPAPAGERGEETSGRVSDRRSGLDSFER